MNPSKSNPKKSLNVKNKIKKVAKAIKSKSNPKVESKPSSSKKKISKPKSKKKVKISSGSTNKRKSKSYRKTPYPKRKKKENILNSSSLEQISHTKNGNISKSPVSLLMFIEKMPPPPKEPEFRTFTKVSKPKDEILKVGILS